MISSALSKQQQIRKNMKQIGNKIFIRVYLIDFMFYAFRIGKVLCKDLSEEIKEQELSTRFVEPLLSNLFDDPDNNVLLILYVVFIVIG